MRERDLLVGFGRHLRALRKRAGLTQAMLGKKIGLGSQTVSNMERGLSFTDLGTLYRLSVAFGLPLSALFSWAPKPSANKDSARQEELVERVRLMLLSTDPISADEVADVVRGLIEKARRRS
jgi:transcriptional regulator with XRE-family HTH domain